MHEACLNRPTWDHVHLPIFEGYDWLGRGSAIYQDKVNPVR